MTTKYTTITIFLSQLDKFVNYLVTVAARMLMGLDHFVFLLWYKQVATASTYNQFSPVTLQEPIHYYVE